MKVVVWLQIHYAMDVLYNENKPYIASVILTWRIHAAAVCRRQPPSLRSTASYTVFHFVYSLDKSELSSATTCPQYVYYVHKGSLSVEQIFPETFPKRISHYRSLSNLPKLKFHTNVWLPTTLLRGTVRYLNMTQSLNLWSTNLCGGAPTTTNIFSL
jgi:hypothetical protein